MIAPNMGLLNVKYKDIDKGLVVQSVKKLKVEPKIQFKVNQIATVIDRVPMTITLTIPKAGKYRVELSEFKNGKK